MLLIVKAFINFYRRSKTEMADPRLKDWPLMDSIIPIIFIQVMYLLLICEWLPRFMQNRKAYDLKNVIRVYNVLQVVGCTYLVIKGSPIFFSLDWKCAVVDYSNSPMAMEGLRLGYYYFLSKIFDLLDTVFFVLRKRERQITFLHLSHHCMVLIVMWGGVKYVAGGESSYVAYFNSIVHSIMYSYYFISTFLTDKSWLEFWKRKVTELQLIQFTSFNFVYIPKLFTDCKFPKPLLVFLITENLIMMWMFGDFYYKTYIKGNKSKTGTKRVDEITSINNNHTKSC